MGWICIFVLIFAIFRKKNKAVANPYIIEHEARVNNDALYEAYLKWLPDQVGIPVSKVKAPEEEQVDRDIEGLFL